MFDGNDIPVFEGPMSTVLGTSLQNRDLLKFFHESTWEAIGLEMEGAYYQKAIQSAFDEAAQNRTTLIVAHRLSTIVHADQILVMNDGRITERGTHSELLKRRGEYAAMWAAQQDERESSQ